MSEQQVTSWQPIETFDPSSRKEVDVWTHVIGRPVSTGERHTNCTFSNGCWFNESGNPFTGMFYRDKDGNQRHNLFSASPGAVFISHWMDIPGPPEEWPPICIECGINASDPPSEICHDCNDKLMQKWVNIRNALYSFGRKADDDTIYDSLT